MAQDKLEDLHKAIRDGDHTKIAHLLNQGVDPNSTTKTHPKKPVYYACINKHPEAAALLLDCTELTPGEFDDLRSRIYNLAFGIEETSEENRQKYLKIYYLIVNRNLYDYLWYKNVPQGPKDNDTNVLANRIFNLFEDYYAPLHWENFYKLQQILKLHWNRHNTDLAEIIANKFKPSHNEVVKLPKLEDIKRLIENSITAFMKTNFNSTGSFARRLDYLNYKLKEIFPNEKNPLDLPEKFRLTTLIETKHPSPPIHTKDEQPPVKEPTSGDSFIIFPLETENAATPSKKSSLLTSTSDQAVQSPASSDENLNDFSKLVSQRLIQTLRKENGSFAELYDAEVERDDGEKFKTDLQERVKKESKTNTKILAFINEIGEDTEELDGCSFSISQKMSSDHQGATFKSLKLFISTAISGIEIFVGIKAYQKRKSQTLSPLTKNIVNNVNLPPVASSNSIVEMDDILPTETPDNSVTESASLGTSRNNFHNETKEKKPLKEEKPFEKSKAPDLTKKDSQ